MENSNPIRIYLRIYIALLVLLAATVAVSTLWLNPTLSTALSLFIAALKALLVVGFFMNLKKAVPSIKFFAFATLLWTLLLISLISLDYLTRGLSGVLGK